MSGFTDWLKDELKRRGWRQTDLVGRGGITKGQVSNVLLETSNPGLDFCIGIAKAFEYDAADVCRVAGLLPPSLNQERKDHPELDQACRQLTRLFHTSKHYFTAVVSLMNVLLSRSPMPDELTEQRTVPQPSPRSQAELDDIRDQLHHVTRVLESYPARFTELFADLINRRTAEREERERQNENHTEGEKAEGGSEQSLGD